MTNSYMTLNLGRDLFYIGASPEKASIEKIKDLIDKKGILLDNNDSIVYYHIGDEGEMNARAAGIALAEPEQKSLLDELDIDNPGTGPGEFVLPPGKYGFVQLEANPDHVIISERLALLEYMEEKGTPGSAGGFFVRTICEDDKEVYQILIPLL